MKTALLTMTSVIGLAPALVLVSAKACAQEFPSVEIRATADLHAGQLPAHVPASRSATLIDLDAPTSLGAYTQLGDLVAIIPGMQALSLDGGLSSGFSLRGFAVTRSYYNGLPDVQRMFVRDVSTVQRVQVVRGASGVDAGIGSLGGSVALIGKSPTAQAHASTQLQAGSDGWLRGVADLNQPLSDQWATRLVLQKQDGRSNPGGLTLARDNVLAALSWRYQPQGRVWVEFEQQNNHQPYLFGTVIAPAGVRYNQLYASPEEQSDRGTSRYATHWQDTWLFDEETRLNLSADAGQAHVLRDETLIGFWDQRSSTELNGYYTKYHDDYRQNASHVNATLSSAWLGLKHTTRLGRESLERQLLFTGVQNIKGFRLNTAQPDFSAVDVNALATTARYQNAQFKEQSWYVQHTARVPAFVDISAGLRRVSYDALNDRTRAGLVPTSRASAYVYDAALVFLPEQRLSPYASFSQGLDPNTGQTRTGDFLEPMRSEQYEVGFHLKNPDALPTHMPWVHVAMYSTRLSGMAMTDPQDKTALVADGVRQVRGLEATTEMQRGAWAMRTAVNAMRMNNLVKTSATQGEVFVGVPARTATVGLAYGRPHADGVARYWVQWQARSGMYADSANTVRLPGVALTDVGLDTRVRDTRYGVMIRNLMNKDHVSYVTALDDVYQGHRRQLRLTMSSEW